MRSEILVLDYGLGNVASVLNMLHHIGARARLSKAAEDVAKADKLILPGVGHFDAGMRALSGSGLRDPLQQAVFERGARLLGICLGMQLLFESSDEGVSVGLGFLPGRVRRFDVEGRGLRVPHMGWAVVYPTKPGSLFDLSAPEQRFYFVHSFHAVCERPDDVAATANHGDTFTAAVERNNIAGVQFHPEKSHRFGMALLSRFAEAA